MTEQKRRRFIAGAICPSCKSQDSIFIQYLEDDNHRRYIECVNCKFRENEPKAPAQTVKWRKKYE